MPTHSTPPPRKPKRPPKTDSATVISAEHSPSLFGAKAAAISQLRALANECAEPDWDGNGARAIKPLTLLMAETFVRAMPDGLPLPEFAPEPDGSISLDWIQTRNRLFSLSVGTNHHLAFAWVDGADKGHGVARFDEASIPRRVADGIREIMNYGHAPLGPR